MESPIEITPTKVYARVKGNLKLWEVFTEDHAEAIATVKEVVQVKSAVLALLQS
jgi:hypothetical protein